MKLLRYATDDELIAKLTRLGWEPADDTDCEAFLVMLENTSAVGVERLSFGQYRRTAESLTNPIPGSGNPRPASLC